MICEFEIGQFGMEMVDHRVWQVSLSCCFSLFEYIKIINLVKLHTMNFDEKLFFALQ